MKIIFWPFQALWALIGFCLKLTGRLLAAVLGLVLMIAGILLTMTVVGIFAGIPLMIFGFMLTLRAFF